MRDAVRLLAVAFQFLTRLPVPPVEMAEGDLRRAMGAFPLVGIVLATAGVLVRAALDPLVGPAAATVAAVLSMVALSGAIHEDGLADTADGLWGGGDPARRLEIMRDSQLGVYGVISLVGALGLRVALLAPLGTVDFARAVLAGAVLGRGAMLVVGHRLPATDPGSSAAQVVGRTSAKGAAVALMTGALVAVATAGWWAPVLLASALVAALACAGLLRRRLGGANGDALGATSQVVDLVAIAVVVVIARYAWTGGWG